LHEVETFDDRVMLIREAARQSPDSAHNEYTGLRVEAASALVQKVGSHAYQLSTAAVP
jgi:hypothetical protein